jgi:hypothetical protein
LVIRVGWEWKRDRESTTTTPRSGRRWNTLAYLSPWLARL